MSCFRPLDQQRSNGRKIISLLSSISSNRPQSWRSGRRSAHQSIYGRQMEAWRGEDGAGRRGHSIFDGSGGVGRQGWVLLGVDGRCRGKCRLLLSLLAGVAPAWGGGAPASTLSSSFPPPLLI